MAGWNVTEAAAEQTTSEAGQHAGAAAPKQMTEELAGRPIDGATRVVFVVAAVLGTLLALNQLLYLQIFGGVLFENRYLFLLAALLFPLTILALPAYGFPVRCSPPL